MANEDHDTMSCKCVERHVPLPVKTLTMETTEGTVELCPTTFFNVMELLTSYRIYNAPPPGSIQKHYSKYVRELCFALFKENCYNGNV